MSQEEKEPREDRNDAAYFGECTFFVHTVNKQVKIFENSNIYVSFLSLRGCSISVKVKFIDPKGVRKMRIEKVMSESPDYVHDPEADPFKELRIKMKQEQDKNRLFRFKLKERKSDLLHILQEAKQPNGIALAR